MYRSVLAFMKLIFIAAVVLYAVALVCCSALAVRARRRAGSPGFKLGSGGDSMRTTAILLVAASVALTVAGALLYRQTYFVIIFAIVLVQQLYLNPTWFGKRGIKDGISFFPKEQLAGYAWSEEKSFLLRVHIFFKDDRPALTIRHYNMKRKAELLRLLDEYFEEQPVARREA